MSARHAARTVIIGQGVVTLISGAVWGILQGGQAGMAALAGGVVAILPALYLAVKVFSVPADAEPKRIVGAFYRGEVLKFGLTVVLFAIALQVFASAFAPLITTYILAILVYWLALRAGAG
ncbi:ATP synthase subunit I [Aquisalimonas asiatica]|uniref:ATP synthase subunit I n=1 Tax=Aquisalimonas asiatica TaxID=406100 RepID=UPI000B812DF4|nr:ATP synthase subunit I [Aquisalimonas asiatica]